MGGSKRLEELLSGAEYAMRASRVGQPQGYAHQQMGRLRGLGLHPSQRELVRRLRGLGEESDEQTTMIRPGGLGKRASEENELGEVAYLPGCWGLVAKG